MTAEGPSAGPLRRAGSDWPGYLATAIAVILLAVPLWAAPWNPYDGGIAPSAATFTLHGLWPYRDYWLLYGPLSGWLYAIPTAILGPTVELTRVVGLIVLGCQAAVVFRLCRRWTAAVPAFLLAASSSAIVAAFNGLAFNAWMLSMTLGLLALSLRLEGRRPIIVGILLGLAFLTRLDVGAYAFMAALVLPDRRRALIGFGIVVLPTALGLLAITPLGSLVEQLLWYPIVGPRQFRGLPGLEAYTPTEYVVPLTVILAIMPRLLIAVTLVRALVDRQPALVSVAVFAALCQLQTLGRADSAHLAVATTPALVLVAANSPRGRVPSLVGIGLVAPALLAAAVIGMVITWSGSAARDRALERSVAVVRQATDGDAPIFVGQVTNRYTFLNPLLAYHLADRRPGTRWTMYNPGVTNTEGTQERMVAELDATETNVLILDAEFAEYFEVSNESRVAGSVVLDRYIRDRFRTWCDFGDVQVAVRATWDPDSPCPIAEGT